MEPNINYSYLAPPGWITINPDRNLQRQIAQVVQRETSDMDKPHAQALGAVLAEKLTSLCEEAFNQNFSLLCFPDITIAGVQISSIMTISETDLSEIGEPLDVVGALAATQDNVRLIDSAGCLVLAITTRERATGLNTPSSVDAEFAQATEGLGPVELVGQRAAMVDALHRALRQAIAEEPDVVPEVYSNKILYYIVNPDFPSHWLVMIAQYYDTDDAAGQELGSSIADLYDAIAGTVRLHHV